MAKLHYKKNYYRQEWDSNMQFLRVILRSNLRTLQGVFGNSTLSDLGGFFSDASGLYSEKNPLRSLRVPLPNAPYM